MKHNSHIFEFNSIQLKVPGIFYDLLKSKFLDKIHISSDEGCWIWRGRLMPSGYGTVRFLGRAYYTHRLSHEVFLGPIPLGQHVLHRCDIRDCISPYHLYAGTPKQNTQDMMRRGRWRGGGPSGIDHPKAKLTDDKIKEIVRIWKAMPKRGRKLFLAQKFNVSKDFIYTIGTLRDQRTKRLLMRE